jgi:hypothetical protein
MSMVCKGTDKMQMGFGYLNYILGRPYEYKAMDIVQTCTTLIIFLVARIL